METAHAIRQIQSYPSKTRNNLSARELFLKIWAAPNTGQI